MSYFYTLKQPKVTCSKCGSTDIVKPANEETALWIYKCMNCMHTLPKPKMSNGIETFWSVTKDTDSTTTTF